MSASGSPGDDVIVEGFGMKAWYCGALGLGLAVAFSTAAQAETGKAGARPGEWYVGAGMGAAAHWGAKRQAYIEGEFIGIGQTATKEVDFDDGHLVLAGLELGYVSRSPWSSTASN
jgi:hypothetical protein